MSDGPAIRVGGLRRDFTSAGQVLQILKGVDLVVEPGEAVAIVGRSGGGKSTLLHLIGLLDRPTAGTIAIEGTETTGAPRSVRDRLRRDRIGFVFQFYHLLPELTAEQNVLLSGMMGTSILEWMGRRHAAKRRARELLERVGLLARAHQLPTKLSGGERQRVAIARALQRDPAILLCDEPTGNLDEETSVAVENLLLEIQRERRTAMVLVTHNLRLAARLDRILTLEHGTLHPVQLAPAGAGPVAGTMQ